MTGSPYARTCGFGRSRKCRRGPRGKYCRGSGCQLEHAGSAYGRCADAVLRIYDSLGAGDELLVFGFNLRILECRSHLRSERLWCVR